MLDAGSVRDRSAVVVAAIPDVEGLHAVDLGKGHPEIGEEAFVMQLQDDESVTLEITAFSRPRSWYARLSGPLGRAVQDLVTDRYVRALMSH